MALRLEKLDDMIGCEDIKSTVRVAISAAKKLNNPFPHTLLYAAPGLGKTSLSNLIAKEMGTPFKSFLSNIFKSRSDVQNLLANLNQEGYDDEGEIIDQIKPTIVFLDEIHQLNKGVQEAFFQAMEDFKFTVQFRNSQNGTMESGNYWVPKFTLIGATTKAGNLDQAFVERFKLTFTLKLYTEEELSCMVSKYANLIGVTITPEAINSISKRSRGVARKAINFLERSRDSQIFLKAQEISNDIVNQTFGLLHIDDSGLEDLDIQILSYLYKIYPQKIGVSRLASVINVTENVVKDIVEPYLMRQGLIDATPGGRIITENGMIYCERNGVVPEKIKEIATRRVPRV